MIKRIHVIQQRIRANKKHGINDPVVAVRTYKGVEYGHRVIIKGPCEIIYAPNKPLDCGARCYVETEAEVEVKGDSES